MEIDMSNFEFKKVKLPGRTLKEIECEITADNGFSDMVCNTSELKKEALQQIKNLKRGIKSHPIMQNDPDGDMMRMRFAGAIDWIKYFFELNDVEQKDGE